MQSKKSSENKPKNAATDSESNSTADADADATGCFSLPLHTAYLNIFCIFVRFFFHILLYFVYLHDDVVL